MRHAVVADDAWTLPAPSESCSRCEQELEVGSRVLVALSFGAEGPLREDLCASCGEAVRGESDGFFWSRERSEDGETRPVVDYAFLREMFTRMLARPEPVYRGLAYLVGLILVRKRHLRLKGFEAREGGEVMLVSRGAGEPELEVPAPHLSAEAMLETRERLKRLLAADLPEGPDPLDPAAFVVQADADEETEETEADKADKADSSDGENAEADAPRATRGEVAPEGTSGARPELN